MNPAQLCSKRPGAQGSGSVGSSGWREKAEDYPEKSLEMNEVGWSKNENSYALGLPHISLTINLTPPLAFVEDVRSVSHGVPDTKENSDG